MQENLKLKCKINTLQGRASNKTEIQQTDAFAGFFLMTEGEGFEPPWACALTVFKFDYFTAATHK